MPTIAPHFKVGVGKTVKQRSDLHRTLTDLGNVISNFQTDPARLNAAPNQELNAAQVEITNILHAIERFDTTPSATYTVDAVMNVITRSKALRKTLKTVRASISADLQPDYDTEILSTALDSAIDAADEFNSKAIGGIMNHTKNRVSKALKGTVKGRL